MERHAGAVRSWPAIACFIQLDRDSASTLIPRRVELEPKLDRFTVGDVRRGLQFPVRPPYVPDRDRSNVSSLAGLSPPDIAHPLAELIGVGLCSDCQHPER